MMNGRIADLNLAWIPVSIQDSGGIWHQFNILLDTGFTGQLALPERYVRQLGLTLDYESRVTPATGPSVAVPAGSAVIMWQGNLRRTRVIQSGTHPLLGMTLLWQNRITIDAVTDGAVSITPLFKDRMGG